MQQKTTKILILALVLLNILTAKAQQSAHSAGGNAAGAGGSSAYSVGQPVYTTATGTGGNASQGVEQAFVASNPLPINFQSFSGKCNEGNFKLFWATSEENNNAYFDIEKSENATKWRKVGTIKGAINSKETKKYEFVDAATTTAASGSTYYRIKQTDLDGKFAYSNVIVALGCGDELQSVSIYPNPTTDGINIKINKADKVIYQLYDISGKMLESKPLTESTYLPLENKVSSVYFLKIISAKKEIKTFKIIKN